VRPRVVCNVATSLDGKIAPPHRRGPFVMSRGAEDSKRMKALRSRCDAVIVGATNLRSDDPDLMPSPLRVVVTRAGKDMTVAARIFDPALDGEAVVAHASTMPDAKRAELGARATLVELGEAEVDISALLAWLANERGCEVVLCEGGGVLNAAFFAAGAVDEICLTLVPRVLGGAEAPTMVEGAGLPLSIKDARLMSADRVGDELFLRYCM
jgi:riboflavin-specific deaminase-like protein